MIVLILQWAVFLVAAATLALIASDIAASWLGAETWDIVILVICAIVVWVTGGKLGLW